MPLLQETQCRASGCLARHALVLRQVVVRRGAQLMRIEVVDHDRVERQRAQLLELHALVGGDPALAHALVRSEEHTSELQSLMRISYAVFCLQKKTNKQNQKNI